MWLGAGAGLIPKGTATDPGMVFTEERVYPNELSNCAGWGRAMTPEASRAPWYKRTFDAVLTEFKLSILEPKLGISAESRHERRADSGPHKDASGDSRAKHVRSSPQSTTKHARQQPAGPSPDQIRAHHRALAEVERLSATRDGAGREGLVAYLRYYNLAIVRHAGLALLEGDQSACYEVLRALAEEKVWNPGKPFLATLFEEAAVGDPSRHAELRQKLEAILDSDPPVGVRDAARSALGSLRRGLARPSGNAHRGSGDDVGLGAEADSHSFSQSRYILRYRYVKAEVERLSPFPDGVGREGLVSYLRIHNSGINCDAGMALLQGDQSAWCEVLQAVADEGERTDQMGHLGDLFPWLLCDDPNRDTDYPDLQGKLEKIVYSEGPVVVREVAREILEYLHLWEEGRHVPGLPDWPPTGWNVPTRTDDYDAGNGGDDVNR